ncbi:MAG: HPF/RaiA family ribosome-associated protein [Bdellovibrio sp.]|nr:HPF/RaiA family ribosome-associated protein [Bdellovibrio sp.]
MKTNVVFKDFQGFEHLNGFVNEALEDTLGKFEGRRPIEVKVIVGTAHAKHQGQPLQFVCEALFTSNRSKNLFAKKTHANFYTAVKSCMKSLERIIRREMKTKVQKHRRNTQELPAYNYGKPIDENSEQEMTQPTG